MGGRTVEGSHQKILFYSGMVLLGLVVVFLVCRVLLNLDALGNTVRGILVLCGPLSWAA